MIDFNKLSTLTITALIMAIVFSVIAIAGIFYSLYRKGNFKNEISKFCCIFIVPFIALAMWILAGLSVSSLANNEAVAIILSIVISAAAIAIIYIITRSVLNLNKKSDELDEKASKEELCEELQKVEEDLTALKGIINDVIEEEPVKTEPEKIEKIEIVVTKVEEPKAEEETKEETAEAKETSEEVAEEAPVASEEKVETVEEVKGLPVEIEVEKIIEPATEEEVKAEEVETNEKEAETKTEATETPAEEAKKDEEKAILSEDLKRESDFIRSLNEILGELENNDEE